LLIVSARSGPAGFVFGGGGFDGTVVLTNARAPAVSRLCMYSRDFLRASSSASVSVYVGAGGRKPPAGVAFVCGFDAGP
jgi:hypothetical protein